jgi:parallel beta-helix repeat protein
MGPIPGQSPVQSFNIGIEMDNVDNSTVQNIVLARNNYGLATDLLDQVNNTVTGLKLSTNTATLNANDGFALYNSSGASVSANIAVGNGSSGSAGILLYGGGHNQVTLNNADGNIGDGIDIVNGSSNNSVNWNAASGNNGAGIRISSLSASNKVSNNVAKGNKNFDLQDYNVSCGSNTWSNNWFIIGDPSSCIH